MFRRRAEPPLTVDERAALEKLERCQYCGGRHVFACPYIDEIEYHDSGRVKRVKLARRPELVREILYLD